MKLNLIKKNLGVLIFGVLPFLVFGQINELNNALTSEQQNLSGIFSTVRNYVYIIGGIAVIVGLATALFGGRDGDDKVKKFGQVILTVALFLIGVAVITAVFGVN